MIRKVRLGHEEIVLDRTAQYVRNEETLRDRSGRPDIKSQEEDRTQQFVIENDESELELSVESSKIIRESGECEKDRKEFPTLQEMEKNIL